MSAQIPAPALIRQHRFYKLMMLQYHMLKRPCEDDAP
jgi:hypothetical protein